MHITIAERWKPYSHVPGTTLLLPFSSLCFQIFPTLIRVSDIEDPCSELLHEIPLNVKGIVENFTIQQDLERGCLMVWGISSQGYFRYRIQTAPKPEGFIIIPEKEPDTKLFSKPSECKIPYPSITPLENLSFGFSKAQDWMMICRRQEMGEVLPFWFRLGQLLPNTPGQNSSFPRQGTLQLLHVAYEALEERNPTKFLQTMRILFLAGFSHLLAPRLIDEQGQGFDLPPLLDHTSPLLLLTEGKALIKKMLVDTQESMVKILPCLPAELHCGRFLQVELPGLGYLDLEWSKKTIRRMRFRSTSSKELLFTFPGGVKNFRLRRQGAASTQSVRCGQTIDFSSTDQYLFDNFE